MKFLSSFLHLLPYLDKHHKDFELGTDEMLFLGQFAQRLAFCFSGKTSSRISFTGRMSKYWNNIKSSCLRLRDALTNKNPSKAKMKLFQNILTWFCVASHRSCFCATSCRKFYERSDGEMGQKWNLLHLKLCCESFSGEFPSVENSYLQNFWFVTEGAETSCG